MFKIIILSSSYETSRIWYMIIIFFIGLVVMGIAKLSEWLKMYKDIDEEDEK